MRADKRIRARLIALAQVYPDIISCALIVEQSHDHQLKGRIYRVSIAVTVADGEVIADHDHHNKHAHENLYAAIEDAFDALEHALESHAMGKSAVR